MQPHLEVVVSGASRGLGKAIAFSLAPVASRLWLAASSDTPLLGAAADAISREHKHLSVNDGTIQLAHFDSKKLWQSGGSGGLGALLKERGCKPNVLVNNAGGFAATNLGSEPDALTDMISMNLLGAYELTRALLPSLIAQQGHVVNIASIAARGGIGFAMDYGIAKHALSGFGKNLREELKGKGVRVTNVYPGTMETSRWQAAGGPGPLPAASGANVLLADDVAAMVLAAIRLGKGACVEEIVLDSV